MSHGRCSGNLSSGSLGGSLGGSLSHPGSHPSSLAYSTELRAPSPCPRGSSLRSGRQETCWEPPGCQASCGGPRTPTLCSPCWTTRSGALGSGSSRSSYSVACGLRPLGRGGRGFPSQSYGFGFCRPTYFPSRSFHSSCYWPLCRSDFTD